MATVKKTASPKTATVTTAMPTPVAEITHDMIARRAFEIWCGKGRPWGGESDNWRQAEGELAAERGFNTTARASRGARARA